MPALCRNPHNFSTYPAPDTGGFLFPESLAHPCRRAALFAGRVLYDRARVAVDAALSGDIKGFFAPPRYADKFGNTTIWPVPAAIGKAVSQDPRLPGLLLRVFGIVNIWLLWKISLRTGAGEAEALVAAFLLSVSTTLFYYSRHLLPYDLSMTFGLPLC